MTAAVFFGCTFIAFGPALALYIFTIATEPLRVIFLIVGAFFWLLSLLLSSLVWFLARTITDNKDGPIQKYLLMFGVLISVLIQEMFRFAYYKLLKKANEGLKSINPDETAPSMRLLAYVSGLGFGIMSGVFSFVNTLSDSLGPGTVGIHGDSPQFFLNSGSRPREDAAELTSCSEPFPCSHLNKRVSRSCFHQMVVKLSEWCRVLHKLVYRAQVFRGPWRLLST
ncbi:PREDICTED: gamma-secretase subunit APH-1B isoform X2 [Hipposideros armiger]|uniref:Gamma-secretase subunit APH-1 n=1 Tax=Hipposideros armiger TaxID=186990 RepID=A0A8B7S414_HIPAR|nr:PREDICTED: gamma-secretase subunit APH-1B isoform X2 [Hipposideros armiger]